MVDALLTGTAALDRFAARDGRLEWTYAGRMATVPAIRWSVYDNRSGERRMLADATSEAVPAVDGGFVMAELTGGDGPAISVYVRVKDGRQWVVGVERAFPARNAD